jgi:hypothetical protein
MGEKITQAAAQIGSCAGRDQSELLGVIRMLARQVPYRRIFAAAIAGRSWCPPAQFVRFGAALAGRVFGLAFVTG